MTQGPGRPEVIGLAGMSATDRSPLGSGVDGSAGTGAVSARTTRLRSCGKGCPWPALISNLWHNNRSWANIPPGGNQVVMEPIIVVHGGAGPWKLKEDLLDMAVRDCRLGAEAGQDLLISGASALDAVIMVVGVGEE